MVSIKSAPFSFVRFEHPDDTDYSLDLGYTLPAFGGHNTAFQFIVEGEKPIAEKIKLAIANDAGSAITPVNPVQYAEIVKYRIKINGLSAHPSFTLQAIKIGEQTKPYNNVAATGEVLARILQDDFGIELKEDYFVLDELLDVYITAVLAVDGEELFSAVYLWHQGYVSIKNGALPPFSCFTYALLDEADALLGFSNCFKIWDEEAFTSLITYRCEENAFAFSYAGGKENRVRLPFFLTKPQHPKKREVLRLSNGHTKLLSAIVEKEYLLETEQMPEVFHECLTTALIHDYILIDNKNIREKLVQVLEVDNYAAQWDEDPDIRFAPGKGKVKVAKFGFTNSNCGDGAASSCSPPLFTLSSGGAGAISINFVYGSIQGIRIIYYRSVFVGGKKVKDIAPAANYLITGLAKGSYTVFVASKCGNILGELSTPKTIVVS